MARSKKLPAMPVYVGDWRKDPRVQALDYEQKGIWFEILCLMWESDYRGMLLLKGRPIEIDTLARLLGLDKQKCSEVVSKLEAYGPADRDEDSGALVCDWMLETEDKRRAKAEAGRLGGLRSRPPQPDLFGSSEEADGKREGTFSVSDESESANETEGETPKKKGASEGQQVAEVFSYWRDRRKEVLGLGNGPAARMTDKRAGKVRARLKEGYTVEDLKQAVDGLLGNDWHVQRGFTDLELICRDQAHVEQYMIWGKGDENAGRRGEEFGHLG